MATRFVSAGQAWWGQVQPFPLGADRGLLIGVVVPESDLIGDLSRQRLWIGLITLVVLGLAVGRAVALASRYSRPVGLLVEESRRIATGHGIGPALSVTQVRAMLRMAVRITDDIGHIATEMNQQLCADLPPARFITVWLGALNAADHELITLSGGQAPLLHYRAAEDQFDVLKADTTPFGMFDHGAIETSTRLKLGRGDIYAAISEGIFEAADPAGEEFGLERTREVIRRHREETAPEILDRIREACDAFTAGAPAADDQTIILIKRI